MSRDREAWFPSKPNINVDTNDWVWKRWMQGAYRFMTGTSKRAIAAPGTATPLLVPTATYLADSFLYEVNTAAIADVYLPRASDWPDKEYLIINGVGTGSSTHVRVNVYPGSGDTIDNGRITTFFRMRGYQDRLWVKSDGISDWRLINHDANKSRVRYNLTADAAIAAGLVKIPFTAKPIDPLGDGGTGTYIFTCRRSGYHKLNLVAQWWQTTGGAVASWAVGHIYVNGVSNYQQVVNTLLVNPNLSVIPISFHCFHLLSYNDTVEFYIETSHVGTLGGGNPPQKTYGEVTRIDPA